MAALLGRDLLCNAAGYRHREVTSQAEWRTNHGDPNGNRYRKLTQIDKSNVSRLRPAWVFPISNVTQIENTPAVADDVMYVSSANEMFALDAGQRTPDLAPSVHADRYAHIMALSRVNSELLWKTEMADWQQNYNGTSAPLAVGNMVITARPGAMVQSLFKRKME